MKVITYNGETHSILQWSQITGINTQTLYYRITTCKQDPEKALTTPVVKRGGRPRKINHKWSGKTIADLETINAAARAQGLTYGQYVREIGG